MGHTRVISKDEVAVSEIALFNLFRLLLQMTLLTLLSTQGPIVVEEMLLIREEEKGEIIEIGMVRAKVHHAFHDSILRTTTISTNFLEMITETVEVSKEIEMVLEIGEETIDDVQLEVIGIGKGTGKKDQGTETSERIGRMIREAQGVLGQCLL